MVTSRDVAVHAGVSQATVSRVMSGSPRVSPETRSRVQEAAAALGYELNLAARAMRTHRSGTVGVVVDRVTNPFYPQVIEALSRVLVEHDLQMLLWDTEVAGERGAIQAISQRLVDGLIFTTATPSSAPLATALAAGAPVVLVNRIVEGARGDKVDTDNFAMSVHIAEYMASAGHTNVGFITATAEASTAKTRGEGFLEGSRRNGLRLPKTRMVEGSFSHLGGLLALKKLFSTRTPPTALLCANDLSAFGALDAARVLGVRVPEDLWIVGFDDVDMASWEAFDLTTARQPVDDMVDAAVKLLLERIDNPKKPFIHHRFRSELIVRGSTGNVPAPEVHRVGDALTIPTRARSQRSDFADAITAASTDSSSG